MSSSSPIDSFVEAVRAAVGALTVEQAHALAVSAKKVRLAVEAGTEPTQAEWFELFPEARTRALAREMLSQVSVLDMDFNATQFGASAPKPAVEAPTDVPLGSMPTFEGAENTMAATPRGVERKWHALLVSIPSEGLPANDGSGLLSSMELGRTIVQVSQGKGRASYARLPTAAAFRDRFVDAARDAGLLRLIDDLPASV